MAIAIAKTSFSPRLSYLSVREFTTADLRNLTSAADVAVKALQSSAVTDFATFYSSDPHLGMFGGEAERNGYRLSLVEFRPTNRGEFLVLDLLVKSAEPKRPLEGVVTFYLHPTFDPPVQSAAATNGRAALTCYATGGFTLGAKLENGTELELNLAKDKRLPKWFRDR